MNPVYPKTLALAKRPAEDLLAELDDLCRAKIGEVLQTYLDAEVDALLQRARYQRATDGASIGYRDGHDPERKVTTGAGPLPIRRPRVRGIEYESAALPKYARRLPNLDKTLHRLWIEGLAHRDFEPALRGLLGESAPLSATAIARVNAQFHHEFEIWKARRLDHQTFIYLWADGIHLGAGPGDERRVLLVVIGADLQGKKHLVALDEAMSESELSWSELFGDLKARGLREPQLLIGDGANGLWAAATSVLSSTAQQRCWVHKIRNVSDKLPERLQPEVKEKLHEIMYAPDRAEAIARLEALARSLQRDYPKAAACLRDDLERMLAYYAFPPASWRSLRTTNPIDSIFSSVRLRTAAARRLRTGTSATYLVYKLIERLSQSWYRINGYRTISTVAAKYAA